MSVGSICSRQVDLAEPDESIQMAARRMHDRKVGTLVVLNKEQRPIGLITDRDLAVRGVAEGLDPTQTLVSEVMTRNLRTVSEQASIESALTTMRSGPFRRVVVVDTEGKLAGMLSLDDILELLSDEFRQIGALLHRESPSSLAQTL